MSLLVIIWRYNLHLNNSVFSGWTFFNSLFSRRVFNSFSWMQCVGETIFINKKGYFVGQITSLTPTLIAKRRKHRWKWLHRIYIHTCQLKRARKCRNKLRVNSVILVVDSVFFFFFHISNFFGNWSRWQVRYNFLTGLYSLWSASQRLSLRSDIKLTRMQTKGNFHSMGRETSKLHTKPQHKTSYLHL